MGVSRPDDALLASIGFPPPPHRLAGQVSFGRRLAGYFAVGLLMVAGAAILVMYFGVAREGRGLAVDTALALGLGRPIVGARVIPGECEPYRTSGKYGTSGFFCAITVLDGAARTELLIDTVSRPDLAAHDGAGRVLGATGIYWHAGVMLARWWSILLLMMIAVGLLVGPLTMMGAIRRPGRLARLARGHVHTVELLTWSGHKWFVFVDDHGRRRLGHGVFPGPPALLDGVATTGIALIAGRDAVLLEENLNPLLLDPALRTRILTRIAEVRANGLRRASLRPVPGDPPTLAGRLEAIEAALADGPDLPMLYDACWRLVWDSTDAEVSRRALVARNAVVRRMGPKAADAVLLATRERAAALVVRD